MLPRIAVLKASFGTKTQHWLCTIRSGCHLFFRIPCRKRDPLSSFGGVVAFNAVFFGNGPNASRNNHRCCNYQSHRSLLSLASSLCLPHASAAEFGLPLSFGPLIEWQKANLARTLLLCGPVGAFCVVMHGPQGPRYPLPSP